MSAVFLEQHHRQQAGPDPPTGDDVEGSRRLGRRLAVPAGELLAHGLPHGSAPRDDVEGLGDGLADLGQAAAATAAADRERRDRDPLTREMCWQRAPDGPLPGHAPPRPCPLPTGRLRSPPPPRPRSLGVRPAAARAHQVNGLCHARRPLMYPPDW